MVKMSYYADYSNYTDWHEVDEDLITIPFHGGHQIRDSMTGIADLDMAHTSAEFYDIVASRCCTIQTKNKHHSPSLEGE